MAVHCLVPMFHKRTVLSKLHEMKLSEPGWRARLVTVASWPSKYRMKELSCVARYRIASIHSQLRWRGQGVHGGGVDVRFVFVLA